MDEAAVAISMDLPPLVVNDWWEAQSKTIKGQKCIASRPGCTSLHLCVLGYPDEKKSVLSSHVSTVPTGPLIPHCLSIWSLSPEGRPGACLGAAGEPMQGACIESWQVGLLLSHSTNIAIHTLYVFHCNVCKLLSTCNSFCNTVHITFFEHVCHHAQLCSMLVLNKKGKKCREKMAMIKIGLSWPFSFIVQLFLKKRELKEGSSNYDSFLTSAQPIKAWREWLDTVFLKHL